METDIELELDADGKPCLWQLYTPEQQQYKDPNLYLWIRRCELFVNIDTMMRHFERLGIRIIHIETQHELFPELATLTDSRGYKWYACKAPIHR